MGVEVQDNGSIGVDYISIRGKGDVIKSLKKTNKNVELRIFKSAENVNLDAIIEWKKDGKKHNYLDEY